MKTATNIQATVKLSGFPKDKSGFSVFKNLVRQAETLKQFHPRDIKTASRVSHMRSGQISSFLIPLGFFLLLAKAIPAHADPTCIHEDKTTWRFCCDEQDPPELRKHCEQNKRKPPPEQDTCKQSDQTNIEVEASADNSENPEVDMSLSAKEISELIFGEPLTAWSALKGNATVLHFRTKINGPTKFPFSERKLVWKEIPSSMGKYTCLGLVRIGLIYNPLKVYIASEFTTDTCSYNATKNHELVHYSFVSDLDAQFASDLRTKLNRVGFPTLGEPTKMSAANVTVFKLKVDTVIGEYLELDTNEYKASISAHKKETDTPEAYKALGANCQDWPPSIRKK